MCTSEQQDLVCRLSQVMSLWLFAVPVGSRALCSCSHLGFDCKSSQGSSSCTPKPPCRYIPGYSAVSHSHSISAHPLEGELLSDMPRTLSKEVTPVPTVRTPRLCTLGLGLHFLRGLRSRFTGGGSTSEGSSGNGLVSFSVLTTGKVKVAEPGLMGI